MHKPSTKSDDDFVIETVEAALKEKLTEALAILKINNKKVKVKLDTGLDESIEIDRTWSCQDERTKTKLDMVEQIFQWKEKSR